MCIVVVVVVVVLCVCVCSAVVEAEKVAQVAEIQYNQRIMEKTKQKEISQVVIIFL